MRVVGTTAGSKAAYSVKRFPLLFHLLLKYFFVENMAMAKMCSNTQNFFRATRKSSCSMSFQLLIDTHTEPIFQFITLSLIEGLIIKRYIYLHYTDLRHVSSSFDQTELQIVQEILTWNGSDLLTQKYRRR